MIRVLSLFSGSLASRIAARLVERHPEVESVRLLHFRSPFAQEPEDLRGLAKSEWPGVTLRTQSLKREYRRLVDTGCAAVFDLADSCLKCRRLLLLRAARYMERTDCQYLVSGDILGMHGIGAEEMTALTDETGLSGRILRPLCSRSPMRIPADLRTWTRLSGCRKDTDPELWLRRLAEGLDLDPHDEMASRVRCKLTFPGFGERVTRLFNEAGFTLNELRLLDFPIFYAVRPDTKIVVAMNEQEKRELQNLFLPTDLRVYTAAPHGPMTLVRTGWNARDAAGRDEVITMAARITATHIGCDSSAPTPIYYRFENEDERLLMNVAPFASSAQIALMDEVDVVPMDEASVAVG